MHSCFKMLQKVHFPTQNFEEFDFQDCLEIDLNLEKLEIFPLELFLNGKFFQLFALPIIPLFHNL